MQGQYEADNNFTSVDTTVWDRLPSIRQPVLLLDGSLVSGPDQGRLWPEAVDRGAFFPAGQEVTGYCGSWLAGVTLTTVPWHHETPDAPQASLLHLLPLPPHPPAHSCSPRLCPPTHTPTHTPRRTHPFLPSMPA